MRSFVCGDIHGSYKGLLEVLEKSPFNPEKDTLITLGDYIDGGRHIEIPEIMYFLMDLPNWIGIIGNHDYWMMETLNEGWNTITDEDWLKHGGINTLRSLNVDFSLHEDGWKIHSEPPQFMKDFCNKLKYYYIDQKQFLHVHAGYDYSTPLDQQDFTKDEVLYDTIWDRDFWRSSERLDAQQLIKYPKVFIGHSWDKSAPLKRGRTWNIDSGAGNIGKLTLMDVESEEYWQSKRTSELYDNFTLRNQS